jgi:hypothetical protein
VTLVQWFLRRVLLVHSTKRNDLPLATAAAGDNGRNDRRAPPRMVMGHCFGGGEFQATAGSDQDLVRRSHRPVVIMTGSACRRPVTTALVSGQQSGWRRVRFPGPDGLCDRERRIRRDRVETYLNCGPMTTPFDSEVT